jgi:hypothetical protein
LSIISAVSEDSPSFPFGSSTAPTWKKIRMAQRGFDGEGRKTVRMPATLVGVFAGGFAGAFADVFVAVFVAELEAASAGAAAAARAANRTRESSMKVLIFRP